MTAPEADKWTWYLRGTVDDEL